MLDDIYPGPVFLEHMLVEELQALTIHLDGEPRVGIDQG